MTLLRQHATTRLHTQWLLVILLLCSSSVCGQKPSTRLSSQDSTVLLIDAVSRGNLKRAKHLVEAGVNVNQWDDSNKSPLDYAIRRNDTEMIDFLLESKADPNAKDCEGMSSIYKCGLWGKYKMLRYLIEKGVSVSDADRINVMICAASSGTIGFSSIIDYMLEEVCVSEKDIVNNPLFQNLTADSKSKSLEIRSKIIALQDFLPSEVKEARRRKIETRVQDSLRHLLETGQADTIHYNYRKGSFLSRDSIYSKIVVTPRVDSVPNRTGRKSAGLVLALLVAAASLSFFFARLAAKHVYKRMFFSAPAYYAVHLIVGLLLIYPALSNVYTHLDDMMIRKYGTPYRAALSIEWGQYKYRNQYHSTCNYSFLFPHSNGVTIAVEQGKTEFDADCYPEWQPGHEESADREGIPVRYDEETRKLSVDDNACVLWNLYGIVSSCFFLLLLCLGSYGKFNKLVGRIYRKVKGTLVHYSSSEELPANNPVFIDMPCQLSTYWTFSDKTYESMDEFIRDVRLSEQRIENNEDYLQPIRIALSKPLIRIGVFDQELRGNNDLRIEITADNGEYITEGELLFKLHHEMIPFVHRLVERDMCGVNQLIIEDTSEDKVPECIIMFNDWC